MKYSMKQKNDIKKDRLRTDKSKWCQIYKYLEEEEGDDEKKAFIADIISRVYCRSGSKLSDTK